MLYLGARTTFLQHMRALNPDAPFTDQKFCALPRLAPRETISQCIQCVRRVCWGAGSPLQGCAFPR
eukprot:2532035-Pyramimonas_sp.AAC.1